MLSLLSPALFTNHRGADTPRQPSTRIWSKVKGEAMSPDGTRHAKGVTSSFENCGSAVSNILSNGCKTVGTVAGSPNGYGVVATAGAGADVYAGVETGGGVGAIGKVGEGLIAYETNIETVGAGNVLCGIGTPGILTRLSTAGVPDGGAGSGFIGFYVNSSKITFGYRTNAGITVLTSVASTQTVGGWQKLGFVIDPDKKATDYLTVYVDSKQVASVSNADIVAANFPSDLGFSAASACAATGASHIDWLNCVLVS